MKIRFLGGMILVLAALSCRSRGERNQEVMQVEIDQLQAQISALEQSHEQIRLQMDQIARELERDRTRIQLSKSSLELMGKTNAKPGRRWSDFWQNLGVLVEIAMLGFIVWMVYWVREQSKNQVSARELEAIITKLMSKSEEGKEKPQT